MKVPPGLLDPKGQVAKGHVHLQTNGDDVREYGLTVTGNHSTCYVLVSPGDIITANFAINSGTFEEFADLVVDGVLRNSWPNNRGSKIFRHIFDHAVYSGIHLGETRKSIKHARMKVQERDFTKDLPMSHNQGASNVGSIKIQIYRTDITNVTPAEVAEASENRLTQHGSGNENGSGDATAGPASGVTKHGSGSGNGSGDASGIDASVGNTYNNQASPDLGVCQREPDYLKYPTWQDLNRHIDYDIIAPSFEIGFFGGNKSFVKPKARVKHVYTSDYKLWASFTFLLRSAADLRTLGFDNVPPHYSPNAPSMREFSTITSPSQGKETEDSVNTLFVDDMEGGASVVENMVKQTKEAPAKEKSKKDIAEQPTEQPADIAVLDDSANKSKKGKATTTKTSVDGEKKTTVESKAKSKYKEGETREEYVARKKAEFVLPGLESSSTHQAYLQRAATEELEDDGDEMEATSDTPTQSHMTDILASSMQCELGNRESHSEKLPNRVRHRPSPPPLSFASSREAMTDPNSGLSIPPSHIELLPAHIREGRRPSLPVIALSEPSTVNSRGITKHSMPSFSSTPALTDQLAPLHQAYARRNSISFTASQSRPSTRASRDILNYTMPGVSTSSHPIFHRSSVITIPDGPQSTHLGVRDLGEPTRMTKESLQTTREPTPEPIDNETELPTQPRPEDTHMLVTSQLSSSTPSGTHNIVQPEVQPKDTQSLPTTTKPLPSAPSEILTEIPTEANHSQSFGTTKSSPAQSENLTEVAIVDALDISRLSNQQESNTYENGLPTSQATSAQHRLSQNHEHITPSQSYNHQKESPILGGSRRMTASPEVEPLTPPARPIGLHWKSRTPLSLDLTAFKDTGNSIRAQNLEHVISNLVMSSFPKVNSISVAQREPVSQLAQASLMSPPFSAPKRKVDDVGGADLIATMQPRKIPNSPDSVEWEQQQREIREREREEIKRQNEVARARMATAERQRKKLEARYETALAIQREREKVNAMNKETEKLEGEKVNAMNKEAEKLERENAQLQLKIFALYCGEPV